MKVKNKKLIGFYVSEHLLTKLNLEMKTLKTTRSSLLDTIIRDHYNPIAQDYVENHIISSNTKLESLDQKIMILIELCFRILKYSVSISETNQASIEDKIINLTQKLIEDIQHDNTFYNLLLEFAKEKK